MTNLVVTILHFFKIIIIMTLLPSQRGFCFMLQAPQKTTTIGVLINSFLKQSPILEQSEVNQLRGLLPTATATPKVTPIKRTSRIWMVTVVLQ